MKLKSKTLPQYWQKQFSKITLCLGLLLQAYIFPSYSQENLKPKIETTPGIIESLLEIIEIEKNQYSALIKEAEEKSLLITDENQVKELKLDPFFVKSLLLNSENKYLNFLKDQKDECQLISLFQNNLIKTSRGLVNRVIVNYRDENNNRERALLTRSNFLELYFKKKCINNKELGKLFENQSLAQTMKNISFPTPTTDQQCQQILNDWQKNPNTPFLCGIHETISRGEKAQNILPALSSVQRRRRSVLQARVSTAQRLVPLVPYFQRTYLKNLCENIDNKKNFCDKYLAKDIWSQIATGEKPDYLLKYKCRNALGKDQVTKNDLKKCALKFKNESPYCLTNGSKGHPSLFPLESCNEISNSLNNAQLVTKYHDCPGSVDNEGIVNAHRIISHFKKDEYASSEFTCATESNLTFANLNINANNAKGWPLKICFKNLATDLKECHPYVPGASENSELSEDFVIAKILKKVERTPFEVSCKLVNSRIYNPNRLGYKTGCHIVYNPSNCTSIHCPKEIYYETKIIDYLKYEGQVLYDYFPTSFSNEKYATSNLINDTLKKESKVLRNLTAIKFFFSNTKDGIVHGIGCAEDLYPQSFMRHSLNECRPLPFIIDGVIEKSDQVSLVFRGAISDLHTPKNISWNMVFNAVANYKELHPLETWTLYGIR
ncbi:hypothetical protein [Halobacteriovorax marinus]|nr:hypothetical protein [Halobacteriovorax marinus]